LHRATHADRHARAPHHLEERQDLPIARAVDGRGSQDRQGQLPRELEERALCAELALVVARARGRLVGHLVLLSRGAEAHHARGRDVNEALERRLGLERGAREAERAARVHAIEVRHRARLHEAGAVDDRLGSIDRRREGALVVDRTLDELYPE
jgi:hypothetical protein